MAAARRLTRRCWTAVGVLRREKRRCRLLFWGVDLAAESGGYHRQGLVIGDVVVIRGQTAVGVRRLLFAGCGATAVGYIGCGHRQEARWLSGGHTVAVRQPSRGVENFELGFGHRESLLLFRICRRVHSVGPCLLISGTKVPVRARIRAKPQLDLGDDDPAAFDFSSNLTKLEFAALDVNGKNYMSWTIDVKRHLESMGILDTLKEINLCSSQDKAKANIFFRRHVDDMLKFEYLNTNDPSILWKDLRERDEWSSLRFQDFKKVNDYSSALFKICSQLKFCGQSVNDADMLEKSYSTFHASNITLQQQYRLQKLKRYSELNSFLLVAEQNNELLMKNHQSRPTGSLAFPEANAIDKNGPEIMFADEDVVKDVVISAKTIFMDVVILVKTIFMVDTKILADANLWVVVAIIIVVVVATIIMTQPHNKLKMTKPDAGLSHSENPGDSCYRCGSSDHWSRTCHIPQHLCQLFKESLKGKEKEVNLVDNLGVPNTDLNVSDFFNDPTNGTVGTISGPVDVIEGIGMAHFLLPNGTNFLINNALFSPKLNINLLSIKFQRHLS
ncbi:hypothetical protein OSB04_019390 [Centaurea solstitialis]|uniref:CCHC-type domain-containing protein n=1 Tax=Centaurea solstitialis TaxID=347529 RepID=A0AA38W2V1_9ASTR|nr:hypothetical protein OSB04_019390 [Centaurea solstitialis]